MTTYTPEQYKAAARLVYDVVIGGDDGVAYLRLRGLMRRWQPTADTEAGRSDALVLKREADRWCHVNRDKVRGDEFLYARCMASDEAWYKGSRQEWLEANMQLAVAIGETMKGE